MDDNAFIAASDSRANTPLKVVDIEDPSAPTVRATYRFSNAGDATGVDLAGNWVYLTGRDVDLSKRFFRVIDTANRAAPRVVSELDLPYGAYPSPQPVVGTDGKHVFAVYSDRIFRIDVGQPSTPRIDAELVRPGNVRALVPMGRHGLLASDKPELAVLDLALPGRMEVVGTLPLDHYAASVAVSGTTAYVAGYCADESSCADRQVLSVYHSRTRPQRS